MKDDETDHAREDWEAYLNVNQPRHSGRISLYEGRDWTLPILVGLMALLLVIVVKTKAYERPGFWYGMAATSIMLRH